MLSIIVALASNNAIGKDNDLLWHISDDLKRFKSLTMDHTVIMGRNTWDSLPRRPLPKRRNVVLTHNTDFKAEGADVVHSVDEVMRIVADEEEAFVMGGATLYRQFLPLAQRLYITHVHASFDADVYFPEIDLSRYRLCRVTDPVLDGVSGLIYHYADYELINN